MRKMGKLGKIRIIGGKWKRHIIRFPQVEQLRPTPDAVRETLFNWLKDHLTGTACLDLFAGSGALGFEAISRGAEQVVMIEQNPSIARALRHHQKAIDLNNQIHIMNLAAERYLKQCQRQFDIIFLDPPYNSDCLDRICSAINAAKLLKPAALIYIETGKANSPLPIPSTWHIIREKQCGMVNAILLRLEN